MSKIRLDIKELCVEFWNGMLLEEGGRYCVKCDKVVIDFICFDVCFVIEFVK